MSFPRTTLYYHYHHHKPHNAIATTININAPPPPPNQQSQPASPSSRAAAGACLACIRVANTASHKHLETNSTFAWPRVPGWHYPFLQVRGKFTPSRNSSQGMHASLSSTLCSVTLSLQFVCRHLRTALRNTSHCSAPENQFCQPPSRNIRC